MIADTTIFIVGMLLAFEVESSTDKIYSELGQTPEQGRKWHKLDALLWAIITSLLVYKYFGIQLIALAAFSYVGLLRMTYFNMRLNMKRGKPIFYLGKQGWDGYFYKKSKLYFVVALILVAANIVLLYTL